jgi:hypothetical protein
MFIEFFKLNYRNITSILLKDLEFLCYRKPVIMPKLLIDKTDTDNKNISVTQPYTHRCCWWSSRPCIRSTSSSKSISTNFKILLVNIMHALRLYGHWIGCIRLKVRVFCSLCSAQVLQNWSGANQKEIQCFFLQSNLSENHQ